MHFYCTPWRCVSFCQNMVSQSLIEPLSNAIRLRNINGGDSCLTVVYHQSRNVSGSLET
jgi:hypothetical protein